MAQDEKSKFFIFLPKIAYSKPRNVVGFFFLEKVFLNPPKNHKFVMVPRLVKNMHNLATNTLP